MYDDIVNCWIDDILEMYKVEDLYSLPMSVLKTKLQEERENVDHCYFMQDRFGAHCSEYFADILEEVIAEVENG